MSTLTTGLTMMDDKDDQCPCCDMSFKTRIIGGCICSGIGIILSLFSFVSFASGDLAMFAIIYTLGTLVALAGSFFFAGPKRHWERLKDCLAHTISLVVLVAALIMVFIGIFAVKGDGGTAIAIIFLLVQLVAFFFFTVTLNKVTWAAVKGCLKKVLTCCK